MSINAEEIVAAHLIVEEYRIRKELGLLPQAVNLNACTGNLLGKEEVRKMFGISITKFDQDRKPNKNGKRDIHLDPIPNQGRRVLFHPEKVEAELDRWNKKRKRE